MMVYMTNPQLVGLLRKMAAAYQILGENRFAIIAYERAADSIEQLSLSAEDYWKAGKLAEITGVGKTLAGHLDELFRTGKVRHFDDTLAKLPSSIFPLLFIPGIGPKKAFKLVTELKLNNELTVVDDLEKAAQSHQISPMDGFGEKSETDILNSIISYRKGAIKENRMVLQQADSIANDLIGFLLKNPNVVRADKLGSLRRQVSTIGDIDIAVGTDKPEETINYFLNYPHQKLIEKGPSGASVVLVNGRQVDLRVQALKSYGAMLQYFTGSKNHNIALRTLALSQGLSLSEYGIKNVKTGKVQLYSTESGFYKALGLPLIPPEIREDKGEINAAKLGKLPRLILLSDIKGDLHLHTSFNIEPSHDLGASDLKEYLNKAEKYNYAYIGISDHNPSVSNHTETQIIDIMKRRKSFYEQLYYSYTLGTKNRVQMILMCEVDIQPNGQLALPEKAFDFVDGVIVSVHSSFDMPKKQMTARIKTALNANPKVRIFGHPTGRILGKRDGVEFDWDTIFDVCKTSDIALEINAAPVRLDIPDAIAFEAVRAGIKICIDTDSHAVDQMEMMKYGVSVARRGWATSGDIVNTMEYNMFRKWLLKGE
jgi:DNA polymerase (family X)